MSTHRVLPAWRRSLDGSAERMMVRIVVVCWLAILSGLGVWLLWPLTWLEVADAATGQVFVRFAPPEGAPLVLEYVHSMYHEPAWEEFRLRDGGLALISIRSRSEAVLEYYARPEPIVEIG